MNLQGFAPRRIRDEELSQLACTHVVLGCERFQKLMGHKHISTTGLYCEVSDEMLRNAVELV